MAIDAAQPLDRRHWKKLTSPVLFERLVAKAHECLSNRFWGNGAIPDNTTSETLALDTIEDVLLGTAHWDPLQEPDPYPRLADIVASKVSNLVWSYRNRKAVLLTSDSEEPPSDTLEFEEILERASENSLVDRLLPFVETQPEIADYIRAAAKFCKRREIAEYLGVSVAEITNRQKRARRIFASHIPEFAQELSIASKCL